jgi:small subunit ribosomal protein S16
MVKIRLRRIGTKGRPFYRVVVAKSTAGRNGAFVETIGTYDPVVKPTLININEARALHWLMIGAQPSETTAILLNKVGILPKYFEARPTAKKQFKFLDKRTAAISVPTVVETPRTETAAATPPTPKPKPEPAMELESAATPVPVAEGEPVGGAEAVAAEPVVEAEPKAASESASESVPELASETAPESESTPEPEAAPAATAAETAQP